VKYPPPYSKGCDNMIPKTVKCPKCKHEVTIEGNPGEKIMITCPSCNAKGAFTFPGEKPTDSFSIQVNSLTKTFNGLKAVDNVSFNVRRGKIFGFLGPNGAGKTTTIKAMLGLIHFNSGSIQINGFDIIKNSKAVKSSIGYLPERIAFYDNLTPVQTLNFFCELKGADKSVVKPLIKEVGLEDAIDKKVGNFSKGMLQLLGIAQTMIGNPSVYILDEPTSGLDARWVKIVRDKIKTLNEQGATIMFSSHILSEVQSLCDKVAIIDKGRLVAEDTVPNLNRILNIKPRLEIYISNLNGKIPEIISKIEGIDAVDAKGDVLFVTCDYSVRIKVATALEQAGFQIKDIKTVDPSLEEAFMKLLFKDGGVN